MEGGALFNPGFLGGHFQWWVGQIADDSVWRGNRNSEKFEKSDDVPGWGRRYKVRIIGLHDKDESSIPSDQLPWAQVMYPITSGGGQGGSFQTPALKQGNFVFGFFLDGQDQQVPVIMGILGNNEQTALQMKTGVTGGENFKGTSGHANQSQDETKIAGDKDLKTETPKPGTSAAKEAGGADDLQRSAADEKEEEVLDKKHALSSPDPKCKTAMKGIRTVIENLQKKIEKFQESMRKFSAGVSLKIKEASKSIDNEIEKASKKISDYMKEIYGRIQEWMTDQFNKKLKPLLKISLPTSRIKLLESMVEGLKLIACLFNKLAGLLAPLIGAALRKRLNNQKNQSPPADTTTPQLTSPGSDIIPPLPPDNYYRPVQLCTAEELVADVLSGNLNEIMQTFDLAISPVINEAQNSIGSAGSSSGQLAAGSAGNRTISKGITQEAVADALQSGSLVNGLSILLASAIGANPSTIGFATQAFQRGDYSGGLVSLASLAGKDAGIYASALNSAVSSINSGDLIGGMTSIAGAFGVDQNILSNVGGAFAAIRSGNISALTNSVGQLAGVDPRILSSVQQAGAAFAAGDIRGLAGQLGGLAGLNFDIGAAMDFIASLTTLFDCDTKPKCPPNDTHTLQEGGSANPGVEKPSLGNVAQQAIKSLEQSTGAQPFNDRGVFAVPTRTIQPGEGGGA